MLLYRIDYLLAQKAARDGKTVAEVTTELLAELNISRQIFYGLRRAKVSNNTRLSVHLLKLVKFFNCPIDSIVNPAARDQITESAAR